MIANIVGIVIVLIMLAGGYYVMYMPAVLPVTAPVIAPVPGTPPPAPEVPSDPIRDEAVAVATATFVPNTSQHSNTTTEPVGTDGSFRYIAAPEDVATVPNTTSGYNPDTYQWMTFPEDRNATGRLIGQPGVFFYGKANSGPECETKCKADARCDAWAWNRNNGYRGMDSIKDCHGRTKEYADHWPTWGGFVSGRRMSS